MKYSFFVAILFFLVSCDPSTNYERIIDNQSSHDVWVLSNNDYPIYSDSILILHNTKTIISSDYSIGQVSSYSNCGFPDSTITSIIYGSDSLQVTLNFNPASSWSFNIHEEHRNGGGSCECRLVITDNDIE